MLFGNGAFSELPFSTSNPLDGSVTLNVEGNKLTIRVGATAASGDSAQVIVSGDPLTIRSPLLTITADGKVDILATPLTLRSALVTASVDVNVNVTGNALTLRSSDVTITGGANIDVSANKLTITANNVGVITWNPIIPGADNVWKEIEPY